MWLAQSHHGLSRLKLSVQGTSLPKILTHTITTYVLARGGHALGFLGDDLEGGIECIDRALVLNPNLAIAWYLSGWLKIYRGEPEVAIEHLAHAMRLSPLDPTLFNMQAGMGIAHFLAGRFDDASSWAEKASRDQTDYAVAPANTRSCGSRSKICRHSGGSVKPLRRAGCGCTAAISASAPAYWKFLRRMDVLRRCRRLPDNERSTSVSPTSCAALL